MSSSALAVVVAKGELPAVMFDIALPLAYLLFPTHTFVFRATAMPLASIAAVLRSARPAKVSNPVICWVVIAVIGFFAFRW